MRPYNIFLREIQVTTGSYRLIILFTLYVSVQFVFSASDKNVYSSRLSDPTKKSQILPSGWDQFCTPRRKRPHQFDIECFVSAQHSGKWKFEELKNHLAKQNVKFTFSVKCQDSATISLYWPMKAVNLRGLTVENCRLEDYFSGYGKENSVPDQLEYYVFRSNVVVVDVKKLMSLVNNPIDEDYDCGNEDTIQHYINRNTTYEVLDVEQPTTFVKPLETIQTSVYKISDSKKDVKLNFSALKLSTQEKNQISEAFKALNRKLSSAEHKCIFRNLKYIEGRSTAPIASTKNSYFPELSVYNVSHSDLQSIPDSFTKWYYYLRNLQVIDASYNKIKKFRFDSLADVWDVPLLKVNLSYNNITEIKAKQVEELVQTKKLYVDFSNNPINCSCTDTTKQLIALIKDDKKWSHPTYQRYKYVRHMRCYYPEGLRGKALLDIVNKDLDCEYIIVEKMMVESIACLGAIVLILIVLLILIVVLICCRRSRHRTVWNIESGEKGASKFDEPTEVYKIVIPDVLKNANVKCPPTP
ncbi:uncharacterized protein LOC133173525 [Saccostrea echinata]|uniref:uncharacterized protein LOC133173525 n=1 Tax=Saccostrea echinata TaxID=191078 RepID=UPI002A831A75|nr:uncharacterized protein LOC133173525 [Saccostrea echinata]